jgi:molecular chaperone DnaK (HSP70)
MSNLPVLLTPSSAEIKLPTEPLRVIAIDLGTTNSTVAEIAWHPDEGLAGPARCLVVKQETAEGDYFNALVPSVVAIHGGKVWVGEGAKRLRARAPELALKQNENLFFECKNEIGNQKTYHRAPEGYRSAAEVGGKVLKFLYEAALSDNDLPLARAVVTTVPASFQTAQRRDTIKAAELAGIKMQGGDLMDEPVAAFLDYLFEHGADLASELQEPKRLVVFDFGGGTCDVAVFRLRAIRGGPLQTESLAVSRYHRLGGGDIDKAIIHEVLIPQLCSQNEISQHDLGYEDKKIFIEPAYLGVAEALKISLCTEISRLIKFNQYDGGDKEAVSAKLPGIYPCQFRGRSLALKAPKLTAAEFEKLLEPFLDRDMLFARETEYRMTQSIFAPITDALDRSGLDREEVDWCLLVGGSSLIPQVIRAVQRFMSQARLLTYQDRESVQTAVARGAAYHALSLALFGRGVVQPVCHDRIAIRTRSGLVELIPKGVSLPFPASEGFKKSHALVVPEIALTQGIELRVEIVAGEEERVLGSGIWDITPPVNKGEPLLLEFRFDDNQVLDLKLRLADKGQGKPFKMTLENPLTNVVNPWVEKMEIDDLEEKLRTGKIPKARMVDVIIEVARKYAKIGHREKAIEYLQRALRSKNRPDGYILNLIGIYFAELGDHEKAAKYYQEAAQLPGWEIAWFNLALGLKRQGKYRDAKVFIDKALEREQQAPYLVLKAQLAEAAENMAEREACLTEAMSIFGPISSLDDWELGWFLTAAKMVGYQKKAEKAEKERRRRATGIEAPELRGVLPGTQEGLMKG